MTDEVDAQKLLLDLELARPRTHPTVKHSIEGVDVVCRLKSWPKYESAEIVEIIYKCECLIFDGKELDVVNITDVIKNFSHGNTIKPWDGASREYAESAVETFQQGRNTK